MFRNQGRRNAYTFPKWPPARAAGLSKEVVFRISGPASSGAVDGFPEVSGTRAFAEGSCRDGCSGQSTVSVLGARRHGSESPVTSAAVVPLSLFPVALCSESSSVPGTEPSRPILGPESPLVEPRWQTAREL